jgi:hypothetical protein
MANSWYAPVREQYMTDKMNDEIYGRVIREYQDISSKLAACQSELKRIGENFKAMGSDLIDRPGALSLDKASFDADIASIPKLLSLYSELAAKRADKKGELEGFGPLPNL